MARLRPGDWICGVGALALLVALSASGEHGWSDVGWLSEALAAVAALAGLATFVLTIVRPSPSAPLLTVVVAFVAALAAAIALAVVGAWLAALVAAVTLVGAAVAMRDERSPGVSAVPVERRPAPPA